MNGMAIETRKKRVKLAIIGPWPNQLSIEKQQTDVQQTLNDEYFAHFYFDSYELSMYKI